MLKAMNNARSEPINEIATMKAAISSECQLRVPEKGRLTMGVLKTLHVGVHNNFSGAATQRLDVFEIR